MGSPASYNVHRIFIGCTVFSDGIPSYGNASVIKMSNDNAN